MRVLGMLELRLELRELVAMPFLIQLAAYQLEAQVNEIGVDHVDFAVVPDLAELTAPVARPNAIAAHAELAGEPKQLGDEVEGRAPAALVARQNVHQIDVPPVIATQIVVVPEVLVRLARFPVTLRVDSVFQRSEVQYRQIEARAVP